MGNEQLLQELDEYLSEHSYINGFRPSKSDGDLFDKLKQQNINKFIHISRWYRHIESYSHERMKFPSVDNKTLCTSFDVSTFPTQKSEVIGILFI